MDSNKGRVRTGHLLMVSRNLSDTVGRRSLVRRWRTQVARGWVAKTAMYTSNKRGVDGEKWFPGVDVDGKRW
jgi:hypothetical protein